MKSITIIALCFCTTLLVQCKKDKPYTPIKICDDLTANMDTVLMLLPGKWEWLQEKRFDRLSQEYKYLTPTTEGRTIVLKVKGDILTWYENGKYSEACRFKILKESEITNFPTDTDIVLAFYSLTSGNIQNYVPIKICSNYLLLYFEATTSVSGTETWKRLYH